MKVNTRILILTIILTLTSLNFIACSKSVTEEVETKRIDFSELNIGQLHNKYVEESYDVISSKIHANSNKDELRNEVIEYYSRIEFDPTKIGYTHAEFIDKCITFTDNQSKFDYDIDKMNYTHIPNDAIPYIKKILEVIQSTMSVSNSMKELKKLDIESENILDDASYNVVKGTLNIAKSSIYLWTPTSKGGYDLMTRKFGIKFTENLTLNDEMYETTWWQRAITGDVVASSQYFLGIGIGGAISAAFIPGTNTVLLGGWAISAGIGSSFAAIGL